MEAPKKKVFMVQADLLAFPSFSGAMPVGTAVRAQWSQGAQPYSPLAQEVARDVQQFIAQGGTQAAALSSPQAHWLAMQAIKQGEKIDQKAEVKDGDVALPRAEGVGAALQPQQQAFLARIAPWAQQAAQRLGVSVRSVMAHAALESGWGQRPVRNAEGADSLNLFGIKAGSSWDGARTAAWTTEFEGGQPIRKTQDFRRYTGLDETFGDYVRLLERNPRYRAALHTGDDVQAFAQALKEGGYATDPQYAQKLLRVSQAIAPAP